LNFATGITHVAVVHCETTSGVLNQIEEIGDAVHRAGAVYIVDAMSSFGAIPIDMAGSHIEFLISSANKCIEGVPGFGFVPSSRDPITPGSLRSHAQSASAHPDADSWPQHVRSL
jgi:2-aminoethylphosphonate-pyruvate transaminase